MKNRLISLVVFIVSCYLYYSYFQSDKEEEFASEEPVKAEIIERCNADITVNQSLFTDSLINKLPNHRVIQADSKLTEIYFYSQLIGAKGQEISHKWIHNSKEISNQEFDIQTDKQAVSSSQNLSSIDSGEVRVEVFADDCLIAQESVLVSDRKVNTDRHMVNKKERLDYALSDTKVDWGSLQDVQTQENKLDEFGDTQLIAAIRSGDFEEVEKIIDGYYSDPFYKNKNGMSPLDIAYEDQILFFKVIINKLTSTPKGRRRAGLKWENKLHYSELDMGEKNMRFYDGDTPLIRAVRNYNERYVASFLNLPRLQSSGTPPKSLYFYDATGRQAIDIAKAKNYFGIEEFIKYAMQFQVPDWAVTGEHFTRSISKSAPQDCRSAAFNNEEFMYFSTLISDQNTKQIKHNWIFNKVVQKTETFDINSNSERIYSKMEFTPWQTGPWNVEVKDANDKTLHTSYFQYRKPLTGDNPTPEKYNAYPCPIGSGVRALFVANAPLDKIEKFFDPKLFDSHKNSEQKKLLDIVASGGSIPHMRWLLDKGVNINQSFKNGFSPLSMAAQEGHQLLVLYLLNQGADVNLRPSGKVSALDRAVTTANLPMVEILLEHGADQNTGFNLAKAINFGNMPLARLLLTHDANIDQENAYGETPLHMATRKCGKELIDFIVGKGASPFVSEKNKQKIISDINKCKRLYDWYEVHPKLNFLIND